MLRRKIEGTLARSLLQGLRGMPQLEWIDQMSARFDQQIMSPNQTIASFEEGTVGDSRFFLQLFNAIHQKMVLTIVYQRFGFEPKERIIHPYHLKDRTFVEQKADPAA